MEHQQQELSLTSRRSILLAAFLAWMFAGLVNALFVLIHRQMMQELLGRDATETLITRWFAWNQAAFMLGAAAGGWCFGWLGDKAGRTRALGWSVLCFSLLTLVGWFV
ncbi:MAG: putative niacin/nicotinamide transporter NaiP, partial [Planctomycetota bacterium]